MPEVRTNNLPANRQRGGSHGNTKKPRAIGWLKAQLVRRCVLRPYIDPREESGNMLPTFLRSECVVNSRPVGGEPRPSVDSGDRRLSSEYNRPVNYSVRDVVPICERGRYIERRLWALLGPRAMSASSPLQGDKRTSRICGYTP